MKKRSLPLVNSVFSGVSSVFIALSGLYLLYVGPGGYEEIFQTKHRAFLILGGGYAAIMLVLLAEFALVGRLKLPTPGRMLKESSAAQRLALAYLALTWVSALVSEHWPGTALGLSRGEGAVTITIYCLVFLLLSVFGRKEKWMLPYFALIISLFDILCLVQLAGSNPFGLYAAGDNYYHTAFGSAETNIGTVGNTGLAAGLLCMVLPLLWVPILRSKEPKRWLLLVPLGLSAAVLLKIWVLAGLLGTAAGTAFALGLVTGLDRRKRRIYYIALAVLAAGTFGFVFFVDMGGGMLHEVHMLLRGQAQDSFGTGRLYIWRNVLERIPAQLLFGSGPDTMAAAGIEPFRRFDEGLGVLIEARIDTAHNEYLNILFHQGIFALAAFVGLLVCAGAKWLYRAETDAGAAALGTAMLCYCIQALFGISSYISAVYFWMILGLLCVRDENNREGVRK